MKNNPVQFAGICIDSTGAVLVTTNPSDNALHIAERVEGAGVHSSDEHARNNAKHGDAVKLYKACAEKLLSFDSIMIFGFGQAQEELRNHLADDARFKNKTVAVEATDKQSDNQKVAFVKNYFKKDLAAAME